MSEANRTKIITRGLRGIQLDSAMNWCDLAMESAKLFEENPTNLDYLDMFFEFKHEAEEHAGVGARVALGVGREEQVAGPVVDGLPGERLQVAREGKVAVEARRGVGVRVDVEDQRLSRKENAAVQRRPRDAQGKALLLACVAAAVGGRGSGASLRVLAEGNAG